MKIGVVGAGYVGLTAAVCFAESGNEVTCMDSDPAKLEQLRAGRVPMYEPQLQELMSRNLRGKRLTFTDDLGEAVARSFIIFITIGTPPCQDGLPDVAEIDRIAQTVAETMDGPRIIVIKSTVPVGTTARLIQSLSSLTDQPLDVVSNPEFLKEGYAVEDFLRPDRVIIGTNNPNVVSILEELYAPFLRSGKPLIVMDPNSSEMTKYAANAFLSTRISFINELANVCEHVGADINAVRRGMCSDNRIGYQFLYPGLGFGGSCLPKDIHALLTVSQQAGYSARLFKAVKEVNDDQKRTLQRNIGLHFGSDLSGLRFAVWGLAYKPRTDDIRESAAVTLIAELLDAHAEIAVHDPQAQTNAQTVFGNRITYCEQMYDALDRADALCLVTEWNEYRNPDYDRMVDLMHQLVVFDGRNLYDPDKMTSRGFAYYGIGRSTSQAT